MSGAPARWALVLAGVLSAAPVSAQKADLSEAGVALGREDAPILVVEYADFACTACGQFARDSWPTIRRDLVDAGIVRWVLVPFEIGFDDSGPGARAGACASELGAFWPMHDALYGHQDRWLGSSDPLERFVELAAAVGLDRDAFRACYEDERGRDRISAANRAARRDRIRATPTFFIDGFRVQGALPTEVFLQLIERARTPTR